MAQISDSLKRSSVLLSVGLWIALTTLAVAVPLAALGVLLRIFFSA
jgi:hypothetical protein